jgi:hypothetical protein
MNSIDPASQLTHYLRGQLAALQRPAPADPAAAGRAGIPRTGTTSSSPRPRTEQNEPAVSEDLAGTMARRLATIEATDPDRRRKAFRVFLESVLLDEWGSQLINDPAFQQLVDQVQSQMTSEAQLRTLMGQAADRLLAGTLPRAKR